MTTGTHVAETQAALEALLAAALASGGGPKVTVRGLTGADFADETARLIVQPPAALVMFRSEQWSDTEAYAVTPQSMQGFTIAVGARNLQGEGPERMGALELLSRACDALAGAKLQLPASQQKALVRLRNVALAQFDVEGTWYGLEVDVLSVAQFTEKL